MKEAKEDYEVIDETIKEQYYVCFTRDNIYEM
jgi:hypothetical protein